MTQRNFYENVIAAGLSDEMTEFAQSMIDKLDKKNESRRTTKSKSQLANDELKAEILSDMSFDEVYTASIIANAYEISPQKASALLKQLAENGNLEVIDKYKTDKGRVKGYRLIEIENDSEKNGSEENDNEENDNEENGE